MLRAPDMPNRRYGGKIADPDRWFQFQPRVGDIVVSTPPKSGTTWTQGILALLIAGRPDVDAALTSTAPWLDVTSEAQDGLIASLNAQTGRRQVKTHTPLDGIPFWPDLRYITVFRHPIDVHLSFRRHIENMQQDVLGDVFPTDVHEGFRIFLEGDHRDGASLLSIVDHYRSAQAMASRENLLCLHYADLRGDLATGVARIAEHVGISHPEQVMRALVEAAQFDSMKRNADRFAIYARKGFWRKDSDFFDSGTSDKWHGVLSQGDLQAYQARMSTLLSPQEQQWLEYGMSPANSPP